MANRFQNQKINKDDHKNISKNAARIKKTVGSLGVSVFAINVIKKHGKTALQAVKALIIKK